MDPHAYYHFSQSVWVASFWIGIAPTAESVNIVVLLVVNGILQMYFCVLIAMNMGHQDNMGIEDDDLIELISWRTTSAHDFSNYDATTNTSLAARVCGSWGAVVMSAVQVDAEEAFGAYMGSGILWGGVGLCMVCLVCWFFLVAVDVMDNLHCSVAMLAHWKRGGTTEVSKDIYGTFSFKQLSTLRVVLIFASSVIPRFAIALVLLYEGATFLIYTPDQVDLILNAIALGFILELDELTFDFLSETVRTAIMKTNSMRMTQQSKFRWMFWRCEQSILFNPSGNPSLSPDPSPALARQPHTTMFLGAG